jgi:hypothetical protein
LQYLFCHLWAVATVYTPFDSPYSTPPDLGIDQIPVIDNNMLELLLSEKILAEALFTDSMDARYLSYMFYLDSLYYIIPFKYSLKDFVHFGYLFI